MTDTGDISDDQTDPGSPAGTDSGKQMDTTDRNLMRSKTTIDIHGSELPPDILAGDAYTTLQPDMIAIHLPGLEGPIIIQGKESIVLGRGEGSDLILTDIEFDADSQDLMSVSRQHAVIRRTDAGFFIEDLESTNGTWLNGRVLVPGQPYRLRSADQVRLGEQMLYVYLSISAKRAVHTVVLADRTQASVEESEEAPAPLDLVEKAAPYLQTLIKIQRILDDAQDYPSMVAIQQVEMHENGQWVEASIQGVNQAIEIISHKMAQLTEIGDQDSADTGVLAPDPEVMAATHMATAREIISTVAPDLVGGVFYQLAEELVPHIAAIVRSDFRIIS